MDGFAISMDNFTNWGFFKNRINLKFLKQNLKKIFLLIEVLKMFKTTFIGILLLFLCAISLNAQSNEIRYVSSNGGLNLRSTPSINGTKIKLISQGSSVIIISEKKEEVEVSGKKGFWTEVESEGKRGWVFGAFLITNPLPEFTQDYLKDKSFGTVKIYPPYEITFRRGSTDTFTGRCEDGHYGGGQMEGEWSLSPDNTIIISGSLKKHSYQEKETISSIKFSNHRLVFRFKDTGYEIYNYLGANGRNVNTPCDTQIKNGVWISSMGSQVNFWESK